MTNMLRGPYDCPEYCEECGCELDKRYRCPSCAADEADRKADSMIEERMFRDE